MATPHHMRGLDRLSREALLDLIPTDELRAREAAEARRAEADEQAQREAVARIDARRSATRKPADPLDSDPLLDSPQPAGGYWQGAAARMNGVVF